MEKFEEIYLDILDISKSDNCSLADAFCKLSEEYGELAQGICMTIGRKKHTKSEEEIRDNIQEELADLIQNSIYIAIRYNINPNDLLETILTKNKKWRSKI